MPKEQEQREAAAQVANGREAAEELTEEQEWCRLAGFSRQEWRRLVFTRWLYRNGQLTEYPEGE